MLQARAHAIADHAAAARTARDAGPSVSQTRQTLRAAARGADAVLGTTLSATDWAIVKPVLHKVRSALLGHEEHAR